MVSLPEGVASFIFMAVFLLCFSICRWYHCCYGQASWNLYTCGEAGICTQFVYLSDNWQTSSFLRLIDKVVGVCFVCFVSKFSVIHRLQVLCAAMLTPFPQRLHKIFLRICFQNFKNIGGRLSANSQWVWDKNAVWLQFSLAYCRQRYSIFALFSAYSGVFDLMRAFFGAISLRLSITASAIWANISC